MEPYFVSIMQIILTRLQNSRTETLSLRFVRFFHFVSAHDGKGYSADFLVQVTEKVQEGYVDLRIYVRSVPPLTVITNYYSLFTPVYLNIILPETQKLARPLDRKTAVVSLTKILANSEAFANRYKKGWGFTCEALLKVLELPPLPASRDDIIMEHDVEDMAFGVGFTALNTIRPQPNDPWPETGPDLKAWVGGYLKEADKTHGGRISSFIQERLGDEAKAVLSSYITA